MKHTIARLRSGFTLIELLIVIALLGALAVGLLATIDPFEQLKRGRDTSIRNTTSEIYNALLRYYSTKAQFPWPIDTVLAPTQVSDAAMSAHVDLLIGAGELKNRFKELAGAGNLAKIWVTSPTNTSVSVCFQPESKAFQLDPNTTYDSNGAVHTTTPACKSAATPGTADCYYCVQ